MIELIPNEPALLLNEGKRRFLVVADLHLGYEHLLATHGVSIPNLVEVTAQRLEKLISTTKPTKIIFLGDLKHTVHGMERRELQGLSWLLERIQRQVDITVIRGNHDADIELLLPDQATLTPPQGQRINMGSRSIYLLHGHAKPGPEFLESDILLMGHIHPAIALPSFAGRRRTYRVWVRTGWKPTIQQVTENWFKKQKRDKTETKKRLQRMQILILPAFNDLLPRRELNRAITEERYAGPLGRHIDLEKAELLMLDHTLIGGIPRKALREP